jgi:hypothetical protein
MGRQVRLTALRSIPVNFGGLRAAEGPLTLGQLNILEWLGRVPDHFLRSVCTELEVPDGVRVSDVAETVAVLLGRHETLRTTYVDGEHPRQSVAAGGVLMLEVCALSEAPWGLQDRPAVAEALTRWLREPSGAAPRPVRVAVAVASDAERVIACAAAFSHVAMDLHAMWIVRHEFAGMIDNPSARRIVPPRHQPLDQAEREATPEARRHAEAALHYMLAQTRLMPPCVYATPEAHPAGEPLVVELSSPAAALALRRVAARIRSSRSSIVLAAICAVVARRTGYQQLVFPLLSSNRFERHLRHYVGSLAQSAIATIEVAGKTFDALVTHTWMSVIKASHRARYDAAKRAEAATRIGHDRGLRFTYDPLFNSLIAESPPGPDADVEHHPEQLTAALQQTELRWRPAPRYGSPIRFTLHQIEGSLRLNLWSSDSARIPCTEMESLLLAVERLLVAAADCDLDAQQIHQAIALDPIPRGPNWTLVDSWWVDLTEVQRLLEDALAPATTQIFPTAAGQPLVAYLAATTSVHTPEQAHARCMATLPDHPTTIAPRHYVICDTAPPNPTNLTAWHGILSAGTGRTPNNPQNAARP